MARDNDPLLQPYQLRHLRLRNRIMTTSHEPAYPEDGMPKARYRAYHVERARAGVALTMTAGSATVSRDSPPVFNNVLAYKDEVVPWLKDLTDACHEHGAAVMIQLTHLGRRTSWSKADWLPVVSPSHEREAAHRAFPKKLETWDIERIIADYADAAERMQAGGMDGLELQAYGHLMDQFWSPLTNTLDEPYGGSLDNRLRFTFDVLRAVRKRVGPDFIVGVRYTGDEDLPGRGELVPGEGFLHRGHAALHADAVVAVAEGAVGVGEDGFGLDDLVGGREHHVADLVDGEGGFAHGGGGFDRNGEGPGWRFNLRNGPPSC